MKEDFGQVTPAILLNIRSKAQQLNAAQKTLGDYICDHFSSIEGMQINILAERSGVSTPTVSRFVKYLGYENYRAFQVEVAKSEVKNKHISLKGYSAIKETDGTDSICHKIFEANIQTLRDTLAIIDYELLEQAADLIVKAKQLVIFAQGRSAVTANSIRLRLFRLGITCTFYADTHEAAIASSLMKKGDIVMAVSTFGRSKSVLSSMRRAAQNGAKVIGVTSYDNTPLEKICHITLKTVDNEPVDFGLEPSCSTVTQMVMLDCLYILITKRLSTNGERSFKTTCEAIQEERE